MFLEYRVLEWTKECEGLLTRRRINNEIVQISPSDITQKLSNHCVLLWTSPNDAVLFSLQQESNAHASHPRLRLVSVYRHPACDALVHWLTVHAHHSWYRRSGQVYIEDSDTCCGGRGVEGQCELDGYRRLSYTAFPRKNEYNVFDSCKALGDRALLGSGGHGWSQHNTVKDKQILFYLGDSLEAQRPDDGAEISRIGNIEISAELQRLVEKESTWSSSSHP